VSASPIVLHESIDALVIGASAGGVEALSVLLPALTPRMQVAVLVVLHLPPTRNSLLVELFAPRCALRVTEAQDKEPMQTGTIYFAPPDYHLLVEDGPQLALSADEAVNYSRPSIDVTFESAAIVFGSRLVGIVLTGANDDGARGLKAIGDAGGTTVVQDPTEALCAYMPQAAIARAHADHVLPLQGIAGLLRTLEAEARP
jgi:two-component system, chemotaxis family, protein-glutamate methylesterase/glutaminase